MQRVSPADAPTSPRVLVILRLDHLLVYLPRGSVREFPHLHHTPLASVSLTLVVPSHGFAPWKAQAPFNKPPSCPRPARSMANSREDETGSQEKWSGFINQLRLSVKTPQIHFWNLPSLLISVIPLRRAVGIRVDTLQTTTRRNNSRQELEKRRKSLADKAIVDLMAIDEEYAQQMYVSSLLAIIPILP